MKFSRFRRASSSERHHPAALRRLLLVVVTLVTAIVPTISTYALLDLETLKFYAENNIVYYNPTIRFTSCNPTASADCGIVGNTRDEKLWSGLRNLGFSPEQTSAIMGNIFNEGGSPTRQEGAYNTARDKGCLTSTGEPYTIWKDSTDGQAHTSCMEAIYSKYYNGRGVSGIGLGFVQWTSHGRRLGYLQLMTDAGLIKYFDGDAYKTYGRYSDDQLKDAIVSETGSEGDYWSLWCIALKYIHKELSESYTDFFKKTNLDDMSGYIAASYEKCGGCAVGDSSYNKRVADARDVYNRYLSGEFSAIESGSASAVNIGTGTLETGSKVTIIGDSITNGARTQLAKVLPEAEIIAQDSKQFAGTNSSNPTGQQIVDSKVADGSLRATVVVALGTNNSGLTKDQARALVQAVQSGRNIIFVNNYKNGNPSFYEDNNKVFDAIALEFDTQVTVADWSKVIQDAQAQNPETEYFKDDGYDVHPTAAGNEFFARVIADAIAGNTAALNTCPTGQIVTDPSQAIAYLQQFILDTNNKYGTNYALPPADAAPNTGLGTPNSHSQSSCWGAADCGQCTALSGWFVTMMSDFTYNGGDGGYVVSKLQAANGGTVLVAGVDWPTGVAIFSVTSNSSHGHTGVVLGRNDDGDFIVIENNWFDGQVSIMIRPEKYFLSHSGTFYPIDHVKVEHLGTTY